MTLSCSTPDYVGADSVASEKPVGRKEAVGLDPSVRLVGNLGATHWVA
ncbi:hypothetical protein ACP4OV_029450 [Aristida adscensionis]